MVGWNRKSPLAVAVLAKPLFSILLLASTGALTLRAVADDEEKTRLEDYQRQAAAATTTIEEVMSLKDRNSE